MDDPKQGEAQADEADEAEQAWRAVARDLVRVRRALGWSQHELAERIGYSQSRVSWWELHPEDMPQAAAWLILQAVEAERARLRLLRSGHRDLRHWLTHGSSSAWPRPPERP